MIDTSKLDNVLLEKQKLIADTAYDYSIEFPKTRNTVALKLHIDFQQNGTTAPTEVNLVDSIGKITVENEDGTELTFVKAWSIFVLDQLLYELNYPMFNLRKLKLPAGDNQYGYVTMLIPLGFGEASGYPAYKKGKLNIAFPATHSTIKNRKVTVIAIVTDEKVNSMLVNRVYQNTTGAVDDVQYQELGYKGSKLVGVQMQEQGAERGGASSDWTIKEIQYCIDKVAKIRHRTEDILARYTTTKEFLDHFNILEGKGIEIGDYYSIGYVAGVANSAYLAYALILKKC